ncbi:DNA pilot protein [Dipodfec virus UOA04_Rod_763]|nr:DNA pilot protein [Dipodfec virus UOA04_Rod_763]
MAVTTDLSSGATQFGLSSSASYNYDTGSFGQALNNLFNPTGSDREYQNWQNALSREYNAEQAQLQRDYEERMSNTSVQRRMADLKAAGLNPVLALGSSGSGIGASTPSGSSASSNPSHSSSKNSGFTSLLSPLIKVLAGSVSSSPQMVINGVTDILSTRKR